MGLPNHFGGQYQTAFQSGWTISYSYQQCMRVQLLRILCQHLALPVFSLNFKESLSFSRKKCGRKYFYHIEQLLKVEATLAPLFLLKSLSNPPTFIYIFRT